MSDPKISSAVYLIPGMSAKLSAIDVYISPKTSESFPDASGQLTVLPLVNGFAMLYNEVGTLTAVPEEPAVIYTHKKFSINKIYFLARTGEIGIVDIVSVPIHDHSSIVTGGPAYGTYFTDDETIGE